MEIRCKFKRKTSLDDIMWKFHMNKNERLIKNMIDNDILAPFKHELIDLNNSYSSSQYTISVLKVPLINSTYYTNYTIVSISGSCYQTVRINYKARGLLFCL